MTGLKSTSNSRSIEASYAGLIDFAEALKSQQTLKEKAFLTKQDYVLGLEHPAVISLGYRADESVEIYPSENSLLPIQRISRGGLATVHSEGQLVIYPVLNIRERGLGVRSYIMLLLQTTQQLLAELHIPCRIDDKAVGLYTELGKIAFCGVQIQNGITQHGLSLNVKNDLTVFSRIRSCGLEQSSFDSVAGHGLDLPLVELFNRWMVLFRKNLA